MDNKNIEATGELMTRMQPAEAGLKQSARFTDNFIWILVLVTALYVFLSGFAQVFFSDFLLNLTYWSDSMFFILYIYTCVLADIIVLLIVLYIIKKNRFILRSFRPARSADKPFKAYVIEDRYVIRNNNTVKMLLLGLLLGFLTNFACILCAMIHGDIKFYFDFSASEIPVLLFALLSVFIQSTSEELWCRGFMYERLNIRYPVWVAVVINGVFFGCLHMFNPNVNVYGVLGIVVCGLSYSLLRWYTDSIWICMGIHTMWNFTQNIIFGLPNSGIVSRMSIFHLAAANGTSNLIYDYGFGVEAALPALLVDALLGVVILLLAKRNGRLGELKLTHQKRYQMAHPAA
ncbi:MAG: CPBP family intramembrane metalloprotease [Mogibacterium sp.]|nr:CPBP family intramembrane metalloprotease [Mogibacterium sp.]